MIYDNELNYDLWSMQQFVANHFHLCILQNCLLVLICTSACHLSVFVYLVTYGGSIACLPTFQLSPLYFLCISHLSVSCGLPTPKMSTSQNVNFMSSITSVTAMQLSLKDTFQLLDIWVRLLYYSLQSVVPAFQACCVSQHKFKVVAMNIVISV